VNSQAKIKRQSLSPVEPALLGFLRRGPIHGYEIYQTLINTPELGLIWQIKPSRLYAMLDRLDQAGCLETTLIHQENRPPRKMLQLSPAGLAVYRTWLVEPVPYPRDMRLIFMLKLYFAIQEDDYVVDHLLDCQIKQCEEWLAAQRTAITPSTTKSVSLGHLVNGFREGQIHAMKTWLESCKGIKREQFKGQM
jgi:PadR family transcriptional regulator, regulatory protein AphA